MTCDVCGEPVRAIVAGFTPLRIERGGALFALVCSRNCGIVALACSMSRDLAEGPAPRTWTNGELR